VTVTLIAVNVAVYLFQLMLTDRGQDAFILGFGPWCFVTRWVAVFAGLRNYMYREQLGNLTVALGGQRTDPTTWTQSSLAFTNNVTAHLGFTVFLPPDFEYRLPR